MKSDIELFIEYKYVEVQFIRNISEKLKEKYYFHIVKIFEDCQTVTSRCIIKSIKIKAF